MSFLALLLGSRIGRYIALLLLFLAMVGIVVWRVFMQGWQAAVDDQKIRQLDAVRRNLETSNEISGLSLDARRERLRKWVLDDQPE